MIETSEPKKVNEILLELKGRAKTYWTKHSGIFVEKAFFFFCINLKFISKKFMK